MELTGLISDASCSISVLLPAGFSGGAGSGAALLLAFGLGTVPVLNAVGGVTSSL